MATTTVPWPNLDISDMLTNSSRNPFCLDKFLDVVSSQWGGKFQNIYDYRLSF